MNFVEANQQCFKRSASLLSIGNEEEYEKVSNWLRGRQVWLRINIVSWVKIRRSLSNRKLNITIEGLNFQHRVYLGKKQS